MESAIFSLIGTILGIVGTLIVQFFSILYKKEENENKEKKDILKKKYESFQILYQIFIKSSIENTLIYSKDINDYNIKSTFKNIESIQNNSQVLLAIINNLVTELNNEYYIMEKITDYNEFKNCYINLIKNHTDLDFKILTLHILVKYDNKSNFLDIAKEIETCKKDFFCSLNSFKIILKNIDYTFQDLLYKDLF